MLAAIKNSDPEIYDAIVGEMDRQNNKLELIASENFVSLPVLQAAGSVLTNKYAEGYPGKRYYGGCEYVDIAENIARDRVKQNFLTVNTPMSNPTPAARRTWRYILHILNRGRLYWA